MVKHSSFIDFDGDGRSDVLVFRAGDGYFGKWYSDPTRGADFVYQGPAGYIGGSPGAFPGAQLLVGDFDGDGRSDVLVFRSSDGYFGKWYSNAARSPDFVYTGPRFIGGSPGALPGAQLLVGDFDGDGIDDVLVFRPGDGYFAKWYSDAARSPDFVYTGPAGYIGGSPGAFPGAQLLVGDFDGDGIDDVLVFRWSDGYFGKWYSNAARSPVFAYQSARYIGGSPGALPYAQLLVGDFDGDGRSDVLVFRTGDGYFGKWYSDAARSPDFVYTGPAGYIGGSPGALRYADLLVGDFDGDGIDDVLVHRDYDGYVAKWYSAAARSPNFVYESSSPALPNGYFHVGDFDGDGVDDVLFFRSSDGAFSKWYSDMPRGPNFTKENLRFIGGGGFSSGQILSARQTSTAAVPPPIISGFNPTHGPVGTPVVITGNYFLPTWFGGPITVRFAGVSAQVEQVDAMAISTAVPVGAVTGPITVANAVGVATSNLLHFTVDAVAVLVTVPALIGKSLQQAYQLIQQAGLTIGQLSGATGSNLQVVGQNPGAGTRVPPGTPVDLTLVQVVTGFSQVMLLDALPNASVYVWLYDSSTQSWTIQNGGNQMSNGDWVTIKFSARRYYVVEAVDPSGCGGNNDPTSIDCVEWEQTFLGDPNGQPYTGNMA